MSEATTKKKVLQEEIIQMAKYEVARFRVVRFEDVGVSLKARPIFTPPPASKVIRLNRSNLPSRDFGPYYKGESTKIRS